MQDKRLIDILDYLKEYGNIRVDEICQRFNVSRDTARRDLVKLEENRLIVRTHGGAMLSTLSQNIPRYENRLENTGGKRQIALEAAKLIKDGDHILMDSSTTIHYTAEALTAHDLVVITNSIDIANILGKKEDIKVHLLGGEFNSWNRNVVGVETVDMIRKFRVQTLFIGACGITSEGLSSPILEEAYVKREMIRRANLVVALADKSKFQKGFLHYVCNLEDIDILITDVEPPEFMQEILAQQEIQTIVVNGGGNSND